jgi:tetratricopeptide (TPR) repeat protein
MTTEQDLIAHLSAARAKVPAEQPMLADALRRLAGWYCDQRQPGRARPLVTELWQLQRRLYGDTDRATATSVSWLASIYVSTGKVDRAEALLNEFAVRFQHNNKLPVEHRAAILNQLVELYYQRSRVDDAMRICQIVLDLLKPSTGASDSSDAIVSQLNRARNNLGALHVSRGEYPQAERCFRRNLKQAKKSLPTGDPTYIAQLSNLAALLRLQGKINQSERLAVRAIRQCQKAHGWYHPLVAQGMSNLGAYRLQGGRPQSAESLFRKSLIIRQKLHPAGHAQICRSRRQLAEARLALGKHAAAERLLESTKITLEQQKPVDEIQLAQTLCSLGFVYLGAGRLANCERTLQQALDLQERVLGQQNSQLIQTLNGLGCLHAARTNADSARTYHRRALELAEKHLGADHPELAKTLVWLGEVELTAGHTAGAREAFDRALALRETSLGPSHPLVAEVLARCGQVALAEGQPARALSIGARAKNIYSHAKECPPLAMADVLAVAGEASRRLHRYRGAEGIVADELKLREQVVGPEHVSLLPALKRLAYVHFERDMIVESERALRRGLAIAEKALGSMHEGGIHFAEQLGRVTLARQDYPEASRWMDRTIKMFQRCYGEQAEEVAEALLRFANCLREADRQTDAGDYERRAIELRNRNCHVLL